MVLSSVLTKDDLVQFFSREYHPTPIIAPWNTDSGFYRSNRSKGSETAIDTIERTTDPRLEGFREAIAVARQLLGRFGSTSEPPKGPQKVAFIAELRSRSPNACLEGLDAIVARVGDHFVLAPLFVAGGVDGRFEFTRGYAESVLAILGLQRPEQPSRLRSASSACATGPAPGLCMALFGDLEPGMAEYDTGGLLLPASVDAPNASQGFRGSGVQRGSTPGITCLLWRERSCSRARCPAGGARGPPGQRSPSRWKQAPWAMQVLGPRTLEASSGYQYGIGRSPLRNSGTYFARIGQSGPGGPPPPLPTWREPSSPWAWIGGFGSFSGTESKGVAEDPTWPLPWDAGPW